MWRCILHSQLFHGVRHRSYTGHGFGVANYAVSNRQ
jgi:hypothetical protein